MYSKYTSLHTCTVYTESMKCMQHTCTCTLKKSIQIMILKHACTCMLLCKCLHVNVLLFNNALLLIGFVYALFSVPFSYPSYASCSLLLCPLQMATGTHPRPY